MPGVAQHPAQVPGGGKGVGLLVEVRVNGLADQLEGLAGPCGPGHREGEREGRPGPAAVRRLARRPQRGHAPGAAPVGRDVHAHDAPAAAGPGVALDLHLLPWGDLEARAGDRHHGLDRELLDRGCVLEVRVVVPVHAGAEALVVLHLPVAGALRRGGDDLAEPLDVAGADHARHHHPQRVAVVPGEVFPVHAPGQQRVPPGVHRLLRGDGHRVALLGVAVQALKVHVRQRLFPCLVQPAVPQHVAQAHAGPLRVADGRAAPAEPAQGLHLCHVRPPVPGALHGGGDGVVGELGLQLRQGEGHGPLPRDLDLQSVVLGPNQGNGQVVALVEQLVRGEERVHQQRRRRLGIEGFGRIDQKCWVPRWIILVWVRSIGLGGRRVLERADPVLGQQLPHIGLVVLAVQRPVGLQRPPGGELQLGRPAGVRSREGRDVVHAALVCHPNAIFL
mmetsp:Transcript_11742/g.18845  ORF Transcript_11742/g.18845 Transcript_11742/m.18845 type:complete len:447 (-) Transcript_11742:358-1698(-)